MHRALPVVVTLLVWPALVEAAAPLCVPTAAAEVLTRLGTPTDAMLLARELPVHRDGVDLFDLRIWLADHGWQARVVQPEPDLLRRVVRAGWPAVVVSGPAGARHAVAWPKAAEVGALPKDLHAALLVWRTGLGPLALLPAAERARIDRTDAEFVATGWLRRANEHDTPGPQRTELLRRAAGVAPWLVRRSRP